METYERFLEEWGSREEESALAQGIRFLEAVRERDNEELEQVVASNGARELCRRYRRLYTEAGVDRGREEGLRGRKTLECILLVLMNLELGSRRGRDPLPKDRLQEVADLLGTVNVLLVSPKVEPWLELVEFCDARYKSSLKESLAWIWNELEVEPLGGGPGNSENTIGATDAMDLEVDVRDKKALRSELQSLASSDQERPPAAAAEKKSLGSLRQKDQRKRPSRTEVKLVQKKVPKRPTKREDE